MGITSRPAIVILLLGVGAVHAADPLSELTGIYVGPSIGASSAALSSASSVYTNTLTQPVSVDRQRDDFSWQLSAGYRFNRYFAVEAGGGMLGHFRATDRAGQDSVENRIKVGALRLDLIGYLPLFDRFYLSAGAGWALVGVRSEAILGGSASLAGGESSEHSHTRSVLHERIGMEYALTNHWRLKLDFDHYGHLDSGADSAPTGISAIKTLSVGADFRF